VWELVAAGANLEHGPADDRRPDSHLEGLEHELDDLVGEAGQLGRVDTTRSETGDSETSFGAAVLVMYGSMSREEKAMEKDTSKPRIHSATTYKLYILSCVAACSGFILLLKFPEMHALEAGVDPLSFAVYGLNMKAWKIIHLISSILFLLITALHIYFNKEWIQKVGSKKLNLNMVIGLAIGIAILLAGLFAPSA
jgi:cation transport ATPase